MAGDMMSSIPDITEQKRAQLELQKTKEALQASEEKFAKAFRLSPDAMCITTLHEGRYLDVNQAFLELTGYDRQQVVGRTVFDLRLWVDPQQRSRLVQAVLEKERAQGLEAQFRRQNGEIRTIQRSAERIELAGQACILSVIRDITEYKRAQIELEKAKEAAEAASRAKSEFLANMSHEIRTPLNGIIGMTELVLDTDLTPDQLECLRMVQASADALLSVINDILDFSKIEAGKLDLEAIDFNLRDSLDDSLKALGARAHQKGLELACHIPPEVPEAVIGDPTRLRQIVLNLVANAIKFTEKGEVILRCQVESRGQAQAWLHFSVSDTGIGIEPDKQAMIFEAFTQADNSVTRKHGGTGLGLTISARLVEMMGGRIWVESQPGRGSVFHFTARLGLQLQPAVDQTAKPAVNLLDMPVLVVDDNATNRRILHETLTHWHMKPTEVEGGLAALATLAHACNIGRPFPLILVDAQMPEMDGFALIERIQQNAELVGSTIMMLSSAGQRGDAARCRELGVAAYLTKPIKQRDLLQAIIRALGVTKKQECQTLITRHTLREQSRPLQVLLVEDNPVNQRVAARLLEKQGHAVTVAGNGEEALQALEKGAFDLALMDIQMPKMDGFEATAAIRKRENGTGKHLPIIALTAHAMKGDQQRCLEAGMDAYIAKPVQSKELFVLIEKLFPSATCEPPSPPSTPPEAVLDEAGLQANLHADSDLLKELIQLFQDDCPRMLAEVQEAVRRGDAGTLERAAHTLKGTVGNFFARPAMEAALGLELLGRSGELDGAKEGVEKLEAELRRLEQALETMLEKVSP